MNDGRRCRSFALVMAASTFLSLPFPSAVISADSASTSNPDTTARQWRAMEREQYAMGTRLRIHLQGPDPDLLNRAGQQVFAEVRRLEQVLSDWSEESELSRLNRSAGAGPVLVSPELFAALESAEKIRQRTGGAFDATIGGRIDRREMRPADHSEVRSAQPTTADVAGRPILRLDRTRRTASLDGPDARIDLGGIGKGFALDRAGEILRREGIPSALLNFGGEILAVGEATPGEPWTVEIAHPVERGRSVARVRLRDAAVSTSGQSERYVESDGERSGHILDPRSGEAVDSWGSVTVISPSATEADGLSTGLFVRGPDAARSWSQREPGVTVITVGTTDEGPEEVSIAGSAPGVTGFELAAAPAGSAERNQGPAPDNAELERRLEVLAREIDGLKLTGAAGAPRATVTIGGGDLAPAASKIYGITRGVSVGGYGEMLYENASRERQDGSLSNASDQIDILRQIIYVGYKFDDRMLINTEIEFEHASTGGSGSVSVEFAALEALLHPRMNLRGGLLLLPIGFVNELHEPPIFLGARRPEVEQRVIPSTWRAGGAGFYGRHRLGPGLDAPEEGEAATELRYRAYIVESLDGTGQRSDGFSASSGLRGGRMSGSKALAEDWGLTARLDLDTGSGLLLGGSFFRGGSGQGARDSTGRELDAPVTLFDLHGQVQTRGIRLRVLFTQVEIDNAGGLNDVLGYSGTKGVGSRMVGSYLEVGYELLRLLRPASQLSLVPYARYERLDTQKRVPSGAERDPANEQQILTLGAAFYPHPQVVLKTDWQNRGNEADTGVDQWNIAAGYLF